MADPTDNTGTKPTQDQQDDLILAAIITRREEAEAAFEHWRDQIGDVDSDNEALMAVLLMKDLWRRATEALDRRIGGRLL